MARRTSARQLPTMPPFHDRPCHQFTVGTMTASTTLHHEGQHFGKLGVCCVDGKACSSSSRPRLCRPGGPLGADRHVGGPESRQPYPFSKVAKSRRTAVGSRAVGFLEVTAAPIISLVRGRTGCRRFPRPQQPAVARALSFWFLWEYITGTLRGSNLIAGRIPSCHSLGGEHYLLR